MTELFPLYCKEGSMVVVDTRVLGLVGGERTVTLFVGCSTQPTYLDCLQPSLHCFTKKISKGTEPWRKGASTWREGERERGRKGERRNGGRKSSGEQYRPVMNVCALTRVLSGLALQSGSYLLSCHPL